MGVAAATPTYRQESGNETLGRCRLALPKRFQKIEIPVCAPRMSEPSLSAVGGPRCGTKRDIQRGTETLLPRFQTSRPVRRGATHGSPEHRRRGAAAWARASARIVRVRGQGHDERARCARPMGAPTTLPRRVVATRSPPGPPSRRASSTAVTTIRPLRSARSGASSGQASCRASTAAALRRARPDDTHGLMSRSCGKDAGQAASSPAWPSQGT